MCKLTNNDKQFGPVTYGKSGNWKIFRVILSSGSPDSTAETKCNITVWIFGYVFRVFLGYLIKPVRYKVLIDIENLTSSDWQYIYIERNYGFSFNGVSIQLYYGPQNNWGVYTHVDDLGYVTFSPSDPNRTYTVLKDKYYVKQFHWNCSRITRYTVYSDVNTIFYEIKDNKGIKTRPTLDDYKECPTVSFLLRDYDGEIIEVKTLIKETVCEKGIGRFRWLSWFNRPIINRILELKFNKEIGAGKNSWRSGVFYTTIDISKTDTHEDGVKKYCLRESANNNGKYKIELVSASPVVE